MPLQASAPISLNDIYDEAVAGGYTGSRSLNALIAWSGWAADTSGFDSLLDFLGAALGNTITRDASVSLLSEIEDAKGLKFKPDGTKVYISGDETLLVPDSQIFEYNLTTAWDLSTLSYVQSFDPSVTAIRSINWKSDGLVMVLSDIGNLYKYTLSTAWDITTASLSTTTSLASFPSSIYRGISIKPDGTKVYLVDVPGGAGSVYELSASVAWDFSTLTYNSVNYPNLASQVDSFHIASNGLEGVFTSSSQINYFRLYTAWDITTITVVDLTESGVVTSIARGIDINPALSKIYVVNYGEGAQTNKNTIEQYALT